MSIGPFGPESIEAVAEQTVRALAAADPTYEGSTGFIHCSLCGADRDFEDDEHERHCPWRLAVEWLAAQDATEPGTFRLEQP